MRRTMWRVSAALLMNLCLMPAAVSAQGNFIDFGPVIISVDQSAKIDPAAVGAGYVVITRVPFPGSSTALTATGTLVRKGDAQNVRTTFASPGLLTSGSMFADVNEGLGRNLGLGLVNPGSGAASVTLTVRGSDGGVRGTGTVTIAAKQQVSAFVTGLVPVTTPFVGTLSFNSTVPISISGIQFRNGAFSAVPLSNPGGISSVPTLEAGVGGSESVLLPLFVQGGGWESKILLGNSGPSPGVVRLDFFRSDGGPMTVTLNSMTGTSFINLAVNSGGVMLLSRRDSAGNDAF